MNDATEKISEGSVIAGTVAVGALIGSVVCPGAGSAIGTGVGAIVGGISIIAKTLSDKK